MKTATFHVSRLQFSSRAGLTARVPDFIALVKPHVMVPAVFAADAGTVGLLNMWYDADTDGLMTRTYLRLVPDGKISRSEALAFDLALASAAVVVLAAALNPASAALLVFTICFYIVVHRIWLKRPTAPLSSMLLSIGQSSPCRR